MIPFRACDECGTIHRARCLTEHVYHETTCRPQAPKPKPGEEPLKYGTHTLPPKFWTTRP
jgi:hypothetical protein